MIIYIYDVPQFQKLFNVDENYLWFDILKAYVR